ncbi:MAG: MATE family efflux transporter [Tissierellia bacterium]|nr:MATE family efflux transporter [Tissierellia bacterium]
MRKLHDLTEGPIAKKMMALALPLMGSSFLNMLYTLTDLFWVGGISTEAVAAVGICGFFFWMATSILLICNVGLAATVSQNYGRGDMKNAHEYINAGVKLNLIIGCIYAAIVFFFRESLLSFFNIQDDVTLAHALTYLKTMSPAFVLVFMNPILAVILNSTGDSKATFKISAIGVSVNMFLDFAFIRWFGMGIYGAALATALAQVIVFFIYLTIGRKWNYLYYQVNYLKAWDTKKVKEILHLGLPPALQSSVHCFISMFISRMVNDFGSAAVAAASIGSQVESISWLTSEGFSTANVTFVGQNYGAGKHKRANEAYFASMRIVVGIGIFATLLLWLGRYPIMSLFLHEPEALQLGALYLLILSFSQLFMAVEIATAGAFNGLSMTKPPSIVGIAGNILRIPMAYALMQPFGVAGIWMAISISSVIKGTVQVIWFHFAKHRRLHLENSV